MRIHLAAPPPGSAFTDGLTTRAATRLEAAGHEIISTVAMARSLNHQISTLALWAETVCAMDGADGRIIKAANLLQIPVRTLPQLTRRGDQR